MVRGGFLVVSVSAWYLLKETHLEFARASLKVGLTVALAGVAACKLVTGDRSAKGVAKNQPAKLAAFEGLYETRSNAPLTVCRLGGREKRKNIGLQVPGLLSFLAHGDFHARVTGLQGVQAGEIVRR